MRALICIDFINEIVAPEGKLAGKGYASFCQKHTTLQNARAAQDYFRSQGWPVMHVRVGFEKGFAAQPKQSPLFGNAHKFSALQFGEWGTEFVHDVTPQGDELIFNKPRVSAFYGTALEAALRAQGITDISLCGVATDLAIESAAREAHDRDYSVTVLADCCGAANESDHEKSLTTLQKIAAVTTLQQLQNKAA